MQGGIRSGPPFKAVRQSTRRKIAAGLVLALLLFGVGGFAAADWLSSENGKLLIVGAASLAMLLPAIAVLPRVRAQKASPATPSASDETSGAISLDPSLTETPTTVTAPPGTVTRPRSTVTRPPSPVSQHARRRPTGDRRRRRAAFAAVAVLAALAVVQGLNAAPAGATTYPVDRKSVV